MQKLTPGLVIQEVEVSFIALEVVIFLWSFVQELKAHILPLTNVAFDKSGSR